MVNIHSQNLKDWNCLFKNPIYGLFCTCKQFSFSEIYPFRQYQQMLDRSQKRSSRIYTIFFRAVCPSAPFLKLTQKI